MKPVVALSLVAVLGMLYSLTTRSFGIEGALGAIVLSLIAASYAWHSVVFRAYADRIAANASVVASSHPEPWLGSTSA
jgi:hypothetical protein